MHHARSFRNVPGQIPAHSFLCSCEGLMPELSQQKVLKLVLP